VGDGEHPDAVRILLEDAPHNARLDPVDGAVHEPLTVPHIPIPINSTGSHSARLGPPPERIVCADAGVY